MGFFELLGIAVVLYYVINIFLWIVLDSDIELFIKTKIGQPISSLRGQVVWITGASSGIGRQLALVLAQHGVRLCLSARREDVLRQVQRECIERSGGQLRGGDDSDSDILVLPMDMLNIGEHEAQFERVRRHFGRIDVLVNNAGRSQRANWQDVQLDVDRQLFELDVFAIVNLTRTYLRYALRENAGRGHVAVTSSSCGLVAVPGSCSYVGAKYALHGYFESLKVEQPQLDVTIFCPGPTTTAFLDDAFTETTAAKYEAHKAAAGGRRMTAERCAELMATALANRLLLSFVGPFPVPLLMYIAVYYPNLKMILYKVLAKRLRKIRDPEKVQ